MEIALGIIYVIIALALVVLVLMQDSNAAGLGAMSGGSDFGAFAGGKNRAKNALLSKLTIAAAVVLVILTIVLNVIA